MNRREFLQPRQLAGNVVQALGQVDALAADKSSTGDPVLVRFARRAMATNFEVILPFGTPRGSQAAESALNLIDQLEDQLTVYREHSEVSQLNAQAATAAVPVEKGLFDLLVLAKQIHQETAGAFDISVGALIKAWGFFRRAGRVPAPAECLAALEKVGMQHVALDAAGQSVAYARAGLEINLGSVGKGYALDRVIQTLWKDWNIGCGLVHGGHSSIFALGSEPGGSAGWSVGLSDPVDPARRRGLFHLCNRALGTSSATYQHLMHEGRRLGHLLDPRTGWPAAGILSATVTAATAAVADALATAFFILGVEPALTYCRSHPEVGAVLLADAPPYRPLVLGKATAEFEASR